MLDRAALRSMFETPGGERLRSRKVVDLEAAVRAHVRPGMTLHFAYSEGRPFAACAALVRAFAGTSPGFTIVAAGLAATQTALVSEGLVRRLEVSFLGENYPTPTPNRILQEAVDRGRVELENQSLLALGQRLAAGAYGLPFAPTRSWGGSSLAANASYRTVTDPFGGGEVGVVRALVPDVSFVHGLAADEQGNLLMSPPFGEGEIAAFAARVGVIATVERIVPAEFVRAHAHLVKVPAHRVLSVSETPFGCHPYAIHAPPALGIAGYVEDHAFFMDLREALKSKERFAEWTREWVLGVGSHDAYLARLGSERLNALRGRATAEGWLDDLSPDVLARIEARTDFDAVDAMTVAAAHVVERKVADGGFGIVEAGVGFANLAAWLAVSTLQRERGIDAELVAEIGIYGFSPKPGEPFLFSNRNLGTCKSLTGVESVLGLYVGGRHNACLAIVGAAQVDEAGNLNSSYGADGRFLVGSGGANDIASAAREIVVVAQQSRQRLVPRLPYVTGPGARVSTLVTDLGVFEKRDGRLVLVAYHPIDGIAASDAVARVRAACGWALVVADGLAPTRLPDRDELLRLRLFDPRNDFLNPPARGGPA